MDKIISAKVYEPAETDGYAGLDYIIEVPEGKDITILQITDAQAMLYDGIRKTFLDENGRSYHDDRRFLQVHHAFFTSGVTDAYTRTWQYIEEGIRKTNPDILVLTGDNIYGETDDCGILWMEMIDFLDSFGIPWFCVYGNHDNESQMGVHWQTKAVRKSGYGCLKEGNLENGNCNYTVGLRQGNTLRYVLYMLDTNGCRLKLHNFGESLLPYNPDLADLQQTEGIFPDQLEWIRDCGRKISAYAPDASSMMFMHIPPVEAYLTVRENYGDACGKLPFIADRTGDMGIATEAIGGFDTHGQLMETAEQVRCTGIFAGHQHKVAISTFYRGIRLTYGLKTGTGDYHDPAMLGTTKITIHETDDSFDVDYIFSDIAYPLK